MKLLEIAKIIRKPSTTLSYLARIGTFKTAHKIREDHRDVWHVSDQEAYQFIEDFNKKLI